MDSEIAGQPCNPNLRIEKRCDSAFLKHAFREVTSGFCNHVFLNRVQQTVSGNKPSQYLPDTIHWTLFRCSLRG